MKTKHLLLALLLTSVLLFSCKDKNLTTPTEERIEENHPTEEDNTEYKSEDTLTVVKDSLTDQNMSGQSDTHGRDVDAGK